MPKNTDPPGYHSREITHHIVGQFKNHFSGTTDAGFRCHCGHKGGVQFTDYQAMTSPVAWVLPSVVCDRVIAAWRAHTKDLDGVHPNAEDQIRDFFSRHLEQPGGPTVTTPRYPLTTIPLDTPKPKSIAIGAFVDEELRQIIVGYAGKLGIAVVPVEQPHYFEWLVTDRATSLKSATPAAMREYLARLLYGDEGLVENLLADEKGDNPWRQMPIPSKETRAAWGKWDCLFAEPYGKRCSLHTHIFRGNLQNFSGWGEPERFEEFDEKNFNTSPNIFWRPNGKTWAEVEEKVKNTTPCTIRVFGHELEGAVHFAPSTETAQKDKATNNERPTRLILRSYAADDKPRIERLLGLARQLQLPVQLAGPWSCTAFPKGEEAHPALDVVFPEVLVHPRDVLILTFPNGEHIGDNGGTNLSEIENQLLWETREQDQRFITSLVELLGLHAEASRGDIAAAVEAKGGDSEIVVTSHQLAGCHRQRVRYEECDARVRNILGAVDGEETDEAARRFVETKAKEIAATGKELDEWKRGQESWRNSTIALRQELEASEDKAEQFEKTVAEAMGLHPTTPTSSTLQRAKWLVEQDKYLTEKLAEALGYKSDDYCELLQQVQRVVREHQTLLGERIDSNAKIKRLEEFVDKVGPERDGLKDRVERLTGELTNARAEVDKLRACQLSRLESDSYLERVKKERGNVVDQLNAIHARMLNIFGSTPGIAWPSIFASVEKAVNLSEKLDSVHRDLAKRLGLPSDTGWVDIMSAVERVVKESQDHCLDYMEARVKDAISERDALKEQLETAITAERQTIAQRIDLALTGNAAVTNLATMLRAVEACREGYTREASRSVNLRRDGEMLQSLIGQIADALDAPPGERSFLTDDGLLNTALVDRIVGYYKRLYTAAGYSEPPQGGWEEILTHISKYTGFKPENPVEWPKYLKQPDNSKE